MKFVTVTLTSALFQKHCQRHNGPRHCFYNLNWVQIWSPDGSAIWWVNLELLLVVPPGGQNWKQWSVYLEFSFLVNFPALKLER